jgi:N-alpha-acetyl-L-2,4-diaminobutyrate deacetylase
LGFWENLLEPGDAVKAGDPVGRMWDPDRPERGPRVYTAPVDGILVVVRATTPTLAGDSVFVTGQVIEASALA